MRTVDLTAKVSHVRSKTRQIKEQCGVKLHIVKRIKGAGFEVLPNRWLIEQVFGCQGRYRRLSRDYEQNPRSARATLQGANIHRGLRKLVVVHREVIV